MVPFGQHALALCAPAARNPDHLNASLTYLHTARLRL
jgi:hypothetical protein